MLCAAKRAGRKESRDKGEIRRGEEEDGRHFNVLFVLE